MNVLVTGGAGFIGSHLTRRLIAEGLHVSVLDNLSTGDGVPDGVELFHVDLTDSQATQAAVQAAGPDVILHQAAHVSVAGSVQAPSFDARVNVLGTLHLLEAAVNAGVRRVVFASSGGTVYGETPEQAHESDPLRPVSPYGLSKQCGELYLRYFKQQLGLEAVALRYGNVYGPGQRSDGEAGVVAIFLDRLLNGAAPVIYGDGGCVRDYVYVSDVVEANLLAATRPLPDDVDALNIATGTSIDVCALETLLRDALIGQLESGGRGEIVLPPRRHASDRPGDLRESRLSVTRASQVLGWTAKVSLETGLARTAGDWVAKVQPTLRASEQNTQATARQ